MSKGTPQRTHSEQNIEESKVDYALSEESKAEAQGAPGESPYSHSGHATHTSLEQLSDALRKIGSYLPIKDMQRLESQLQHPSRGKNKFFQETLDEAKMAKPLLKAVVTGNPEALIAAILRNPQAFFMPGDIKDPAGQVFYRVSAAQMIIFLCDDDMKMLVERAIAERLPAEEAQAFIKQWQEQAQALGRGGADLVKLDRDPLLDPDFRFEDVLQFKKTYTMFNKPPQEVCYSLLENPDGIAYYKDEENQVHWYYVNLDTQTITPVEFAPLTIPNDCSEAEQEKLIAQQQAYDNLLTKMDAMEPMSAKRSSNDEHQVITKMMRAENKPVELVRQGVQYEQGGIRYRDSRSDEFNGFHNDYRTCISLYEQEQWGEGDRVFRERIGARQKRIIWLLQRFCEEDRPFYPLPDFKSSPFQRGFNIHRGRVDAVDIAAVYDVNYGYITVYDVNSECFVKGFGSDFAIYKGAEGLRMAWGGRDPMLGARGGDVDGELVAVTRLVEDAKANVAEFKFEQDLAHQGIRPAR